MGGVVVSANGSPVAIGGARQQVLVAALALAPGHVVRTERLIDLIWGDVPPDGARRTLQSSVSKLRSALGPDNPVHTASAGYLIELDRTDVDLLGFQHIAEEAFALAEADPAAGAALLGTATDSWHDPLAGLRLSDAMTATLAPFHELHTQVVERRCTALIDCGEPAIAARILADMTIQNPTNEKLWLELARSLVALGRRNDALDAVQRARHALRSELGVDLGPQLAQFELKVLEGTASLAAPVMPPGLRSNNLQPDPDEFLDRPEVDELASLLAPCKVVSIVGAGGIGKTRCALAVGHRAVADGSWSDGVWFVDLTSLPNDAPDISAAILTAIGLGRQGLVSIDEAVADYFSGREVLLILDNCEHVSNGVRAFITDLFRSASHVAVLATTRVRLGISAERVVPLGPMSHEAAHDLFIARVSELGAGPFPLDDVEDLCTALDNYPLAIEIAAGRTRAMSVREILERLDRQSILARQRVGAGPDGRETALPSEVRHASLETALDWSLTQLESRPRATLHRASAFLGDFDLAAAESVLTTEGSGEADLLNDLGVLVEHHLLFRDQRRARFGLLEPIRQTLLAREPISDEVSRRHCEHFTREAHRIGEGVLGKDEAQWWSQFESESVHLRAAVRWAADREEFALLESAMRSMAVVVLMGGETGPGEWAADAIDRAGAAFGEIPYTSLAAAAGWATAMDLGACDDVLNALDDCVTDPRLCAMVNFVKVYRDPANARKWSKMMFEASIDADDEALVALASLRADPRTSIAIADQHGNPSMSSFARGTTYALLPSSEQPRNLHLVDECFRFAVSSNNQSSIGGACVPRGTSLCRAGDVGRGAPFLLEALERALRQRLPQSVWGVIEAIASLLPVMQRDPATSAMLWSAVDATKYVPSSRVVRYPERPAWVEAQLSARELLAAQHQGSQLGMDAAARETRKAVERFV